MKKGSVVAAFLLALLICIPAAMAQSTTCASVAPSNSFNAALLGSGISGAAGSQFGFANVIFSLNGTQVTVNATSLGLGNTITGIELFDGQPGTSNARLVQTFTSSSNNFSNGQFSGTLFLSPVLVSQIQANPSNFFFVINTTDFPQGAIAGALAPARPQLISGTLSGSNISGGSTIGAGSFLLSIGPGNGSGAVPLSFDIATFGLGNSFNSLQLMPAGSNTPLVIFGNNSTANAGRLAGTVMISSALAQQLLANPCAFTLGLNTPTFPNGAVVGALAVANEIFIPVVGSARGATGNNFMTDLSIFNNSALGLSGQSATANAFIQFFPTGTSTSPSTVAAQSVTALNVPPRGTTTLRDLTSSLFNNAITGIGALRIVSSGSVFANARIYDNQIASGRGTAGQFEPGLFRSQALQQGVLVGVGSVSPDSNLAGGQSFRTNVGLFNPNDTATTIALELRDNSGNVIGSRILALAPWMHTQIPLAGGSGVFNTFTGDVATASIFFLSGTPVFAYASMVDNISGDASFVTPSSQQFANIGGSVTSSQ
jgi:hypothetical protein